MAEGDSRSSPDERSESRARFAPSDVPKPDARNFEQHFLRPLLTRMSMETPASAVFRFKCFFGTGHLQFGPDDERAEERQIAVDRSSAGSLLPPSWMPPASLPRTGLNACETSLKPLAPNKSIKAMAARP